MKITLVKPQPRHKEMILDYKREFIAAGDHLHGTAMLGDYDTFEEWYANLVKNSSEETVAEGRVPATTLLAVDESGKLAGMIDIRHRLNSYLLAWGGHIGYSVRPSLRRQGCATQMLTQAKDVCRSLGMDRVLVTCDKTNTASAATILKCGGVLENEATDTDGVIHQRYWIEL